MPKAKISRSLKTNKAYAVADSLAARLTYGAQQRRLAGFKLKCHKT